MAMTNAERDILRGLAKRKLEIAGDRKNTDRKKLWRLARWVEITREEIIRNW